MKSLEHKAATEPSKVNYCLLYPMRSVRSDLVLDIERNVRRLAVLFLPALHLFPKLSLDLLECREPDG